MTWFKVDDSFHSHPKVLATPPAALGLWVVAGAWSSAHLTDGVVPDRALPLLLPDSAKLARDLVTAGLWIRVRGGYKFHDWIMYQPTSSDVRRLRAIRAEAGRKGGLSSANGTSKTQANAQAVASPVLQPPALSSTRKAGPRARASPAPRDPNPKPAWCGYCNERTRIVDADVPLPLPRLPPPRRNTPTMTSHDPPPHWCGYPGCAVTGYCQPGACEVEQARAAALARQQAAWRRRAATVRAAQARSQPPDAA